jgi:hypothetical protein
MAAKAAREHDHDYQCGGELGGGDELRITNYAFDASHE